MQDHSGRALLFGKRSDKNPTGTVNVYSVEPAGWTWPQFGAIRSSRGIFLVKKQRPDSTHCFCVPLFEFQETVAYILGAFFPSPPPPPPPPPHIPFSPSLSGLFLSVALSIKVLFCLALSVNQSINPIFIHKSPKSCGARSKYDHASSKSCSKSAKADMRTKRERRERGGREEREGGRKPSTPIILRVGQQKQHRVDDESYDIFTNQPIITGTCEQMVRS